MDVKCVHGVVEVSGVGVPICQLVWECQSASWCSVPAVPCTCSIYMIRVWTQTSGGIYMVGKYVVSNI